MSADSTYFEQEITRIHKLLEDSDSVVTWNEKISDPDNPNQKRQIDFTIRKGGLLTIGECRIRQRPQDVTWIEELIGRKISLGADSVIAVSNSGFTKGAIRKGSAHGIFLREIVNLTDQEIIDWGNSVDAKVHYLKIKNLAIQVIHSGNSLDAQSRSAMTKEFSQHNSLLPLILQGIYEKIDVDQYGENTTGKILPTEVFMTGCHLCGCEVPKFIVSFKFSLHAVNLSAPCIRTYRKPSKIMVGVDTTIERIRSAGIAEVIQSGDRASMQMDFSNFRIPPSSAMISVQYDFKRLVGCKIEHIGNPSIPISFEGMSVALSFQSA